MYIHINGIGFNTWMYVLSGISIGLCFFLLGFLKKKYRRMDIVFLVNFTLLAVICFIQLFTHYPDFVNEFQMYHNKKPEQRMVDFYKRAYLFSQYAQTHHPGKHKGELITNLNPKDPNDMLHYLSLQYYLYPIYWRDSPDNNPADCLIIYNKDDPQSFVKNGYQQYPVFKNKNLIAVNKSTFSLQRPVVLDSTQDGLMILLKMLTSIFIPVFFGYSCVRFLFRRYPLKAIFLFPLSFGLGFGFLSQLMLVWGILKIPYTLFSIGIPFLFGGCLLLGVTFKRRQGLDGSNAKVDNTEFIVEKKAEKMIPFMKALLTIGVFYIGYYILFVFWRALDVPVQNWDAVTTISFKAKVFFHERGIAWLKHLLHNSYPLQVVFSETWIALTLGQWSERLIKLIFPVTMLSYLMIHYAYLKELTNSKWAWMGVFFVVASNFFIFHSTIGYRDLPMLFFNCTTVILLLMWCREKSDAFLYSAAFFSGFTTFTKLEGTGYGFVHLMLLFCILKILKNVSLKQKIKDAFKFILPSFSICALYHVYKIVIGISSGANRFQVEVTGEYVNRFVTVMAIYAENLFLSGNWNIVWFILFCSLINYIPRKGFVEIRLILYSLIMFFGLYFFISVFTPNYISLAGSESATVLSRVILHFYPLAVLLIVLLNKDISPVDEK